MQAAILTAPGELVVADVADPRIEAGTDAIVQITAAGVCGADLRGFAGKPGPARGPRCGHEFVGVVIVTGAEVTTVQLGSVVVAPFMYADGTCAHCRRGMSASCQAGGMWGVTAGGGQAEAVRVPFADATLAVVPVDDENDQRIPAVLALADVMATGHHAIHATGRPVPETVAVIGDGAVGLCAVLAARVAGAERIFLFGRHEKRLGVGAALGATDVISECGPEAHAGLCEATGGIGAGLVVDAVGEQDALETAMAACADGGALSLVGGPHGAIDSVWCFRRNITISGGLAPARSYLPTLLGEVMAGRLNPAPVFDHTVALADVPDAYRRMARREVTKVLVKP